MEDWKIIFDGSVFVVDHIGKAPFGRPGAEVLVERYDLAEGFQQACQSEFEVRGLLRDLGMGPTKAAPTARAIWTEMEKTLRDG
jgi:hypothetical protein